MKAQKNLKKSEIKLEIENLEDLWYLSFVVDKGDLVQGKTIRKIKLDTSTDRKATIIKKSVFLEIKVEKTELTQESLRLSGKITQGPEDIPRGSYHTITVEPNSKIKITKDWLDFQVEKIEEACQTKPPQILIIVHNREEAFFALMKKYGYELILHLKGEVIKKRTDEKPKSNFYKELIKKIEQYKDRYKIKTLLLASPAFFKEDLLKLFSANLKKITILATCSSASKNGINEVLKRDEAKAALEKERASQELKAVDELLKEISKDGKYTYGLKETKLAAEAGAITNLLVTDKKIKQMREKETFHKLNYILKLADQSKAKILILSSTLESGKKLDGLTGIASLLRYKLVF